MISFCLTIVRLIKATYRASEDPEFRALAIFAIVLLLSGTLLKFLRHDDDNYRLWWSPGRC